MTRPERLKRSVPALVLVLAILWTGVALGAWRTEASGIWREADSRHPRKLNLELFIPSDYEDGTRICARYRNYITAKPRKGKVSVRAEVYRTNPSTGEVVSVETFRLPRKQVVEGTYYACGSAKTLSAGDTVIFMLVFKGLPRTGSAEGFKDQLEVVVSAESLLVPRSSMSVDSASPLNTEFSERGGSTTVWLSYKCNETQGCRAVAWFAGPWGLTRWGGRGELVRGSGRVRIIIQTSCENPGEAAYGVVGRLERLDGFLLSEDWLPGSLRCPQ